MNLLHIRLDGDQTAFEPGAEISGLAAWQVDAGAAAVELRLCWVAKGKGTPDIEVVEVLPLAGQTTMDKATFRFRLPESPYSFSGKLISLQWLLELVILPQKESKQIELTIGPGGREVVLPVS